MSKKRHTAERLGIGSPEAQTPFADSLVADHNSSRCEDQLNITQTQAKAVIQPDRLVGDFGRKAEASVRIGRRAHAHDRATGPGSCQLDNTARTEGDPLDNQPVFISTPRTGGSPDGATLSDPSCGRSPEE